MTDQSKDDDNDRRPVAGARPRLFLNITTEDVDDCCLVMCDRLMDLQEVNAQRHRPALNITLQHRYKNVHTCAYTYMHICIYTCIIYIDAFCHELKVFIKYLLKMTFPLLSPPPSLLKPVFLALPFLQPMGKLLWILGEYCGDIV